MKHWPLIPEFAARRVELEQASLLRSEPRPSGAINFAGNDYLGIRGDFGSGASRLLGADRFDLDVAETEFSRWLCGEATVVSSGYAANAAAVGAAVGRHDLVLSDSRNHASLVDALRLSRARIEVFQHLDLEDALSKLRARRPGQTVWCVTESYFSMDADSPDLAQWSAALRASDVRLILDESHAIGIFGPGGRGMCFEGDAALPDLLTFGLGKAFGAAGGIVCGAPGLRSALVNGARPVMFSTAPPPALLRALVVQLAHVERADAERRSVLAASEQLRRDLRLLGLHALGHGPIVPVLVGDEARALKLGAALLVAGIDAPAIRYPTVARGQARLRLSLSASHTNADYRALLSALEEQL